MPIAIKTITDSISLFKYPQLQLVTVGNWKVVCNKNNFKVGDKVLYVGINSWISKNTKYSTILKPYLYGCGYWIRPIKIAGIVSSGLVLPMSLMDIQLQVHEYEKLPYPYLQDVLTSIVFNSKYDISKVSAANERSEYKVSVIETNIRLDVVNLISELTSYADSYNEEYPYCKALLFEGVDNKYNFYVHSIRYYITQEQFPVYDTTMSGDYEVVETNTEPETVEMDVSMIPLSHEYVDEVIANIQTTDGNIDTN